jgi:hypothetical protein
MKGTKRSDYNERQKRRKYNNELKLKRTLPSTPAHFFALLFAGAFSFAGAFFAVAFFFFCLIILSLPMLEASELEPPSSSSSSGSSSSASCKGEDGQYG